jgi:hypothetical protein
VGGGPPPVGVSATELPLTVNPRASAVDRGLRPEAIARLLLIDDSATDGYDGTKCTSPDYTETNGIRRGTPAAPVDPARAPRAPASSATATARRSRPWPPSPPAPRPARGRPHALDAPESDIPLWGNGADFLRFFLAQLAIADPIKPASGAFVDNYASYFGVGYRGGAPGERGQADAQSLQIYEGRTSAATHLRRGWCGGSGAAAIQYGRAARPPWPTLTPSAGLDQSWPTGINDPSQWQLQAGAPIAKVFSYSFPTLTLVDSKRVGNVTGDPVSGLVFGPPAPLPASEFVGYYQNGETSHVYALACDIAWSAPVDGDYLVITAESPELGEQEVAMAMDGKSAPQDRISVTLATDTSSILRDLKFHVFYIPATGSITGTVTVSNLRRVKVETASSSETPT